jgi:hypothetical protein
VRLEKACYHAQQAEIDRLRELLARYQSIGIRRYHEGEARHRLIGTEVWSENVSLGRALQQREVTIQRLTRLNAVLKRLLADGELQRQEVQR